MKLTERIRGVTKDTWDAVKGRVAASCRVGRIRRVIDGTKARRVWIVAGLVALVVVWVAFPEQFRDHLQLLQIHSLGGNEGLILLETPQVFTRQRLVNDRAMQAAWLEAQLERTTELMNQGRFAKPDFIKFARQQLSLALRPREPQSAPATQDDVRKRLGALGLTAPPLDEFEDAARYREAIRNDLMGTALDDRHDIEGNTIYRLNFNVSVLPPKGSDRVAAVVVDLFEVEDGKTDTQDLDKAYVEILYDWRERLREYIDRISQDRVFTIMTGSDLRFDEDKELETWLTTATAEALGKLGSDHDPTEKWDRFLERLHVDYAKGLDERALSIAATFVQSVRLLREAWGKAGQGQNDFIRQMLSYCQRNKTIDVGVFAGPTAVKDVGEHERIRECPEIPKYNRRLADIEILDTLRVIEKSFASPTGAKSPCLSVKSGKFEDLVRASVIPAPARSRPPASSGHSECTQAGATIYASRYTADWYARIFDIVGSFVVDNVLKKEARTSTPDSKQRAQHIRLDQFFQKVDVGAGACSPGTCRPSLDLRAKDKELVEAAVNLRTTLQDRTAAFTYAVVPNKATLRSEVARRSGADVAANLDPSSTVAIRVGGSVDAEAAGVERDPVIIGFGDWGTRAQERKRAPGETRFGWAMFPRPGLKDGMAKRQLPENYTVGALVSLPGWWKVASLRVNTCWISESTLLSTADQISVCRRETGTQSYGLTLRLPGEAQELMNNLRFEVIRHPYIDRDPFDVAAPVEVGREAVIMIRGGRLWRSPVVNLGSQKADTIEVLPDMRGIIARFRCVIPEAGSPGARLGLVSGGASNAQFSRPLRVITSEGMTSAVAIPVHPFTARIGYANQTRDEMSRAAPNAGGGTTSSNRAASAGVAPAATSQTNQVLDKPCWLKLEEEAAARKPAPRSPASRVSDFSD
jgi:hypothetical protein